MVEEKLNLLMERFGQSQKDMDMKLTTAITKK